MNKYMFRWPVRVYYEDTDAGGVVYHASYVAFYERARTEMLRHHHFSQQVLLAERVAFVVRKMTLEYFAPARSTICSKSKPKLRQCVAPHWFSRNALSTQRTPC